MRRCVLIDPHRIDDATHLGELLPAPAIAGKARHFSCAHRANLAEAYLCDHPLETRAANSAPPFDISKEGLRKADDQLF